VRLDEPHVVEAIASERMIEQAGDAETRVAARASQAPRERETGSRYIPRSVLRVVYARDGGQCTFTNAQGQRCATRGFLEVHHHDTAHACGGAATVENLRLMCAPHNALLAERDMGRRFMVRKLRQVRAERAARSARTTDALCLHETPVRA